MDSNGNSLIEVGLDLRSGFESQQAVPR